MWALMAAIFAGRTLHRMISIQFFELLDSVNGKSILIRGHFGAMNTYILQKESGDALEGSFKTLGV